MEVRNWDFGMGNLYYSPLRVRHSIFIGIQNAESFSFRI